MRELLTRERGMTITELMVGLSIGLIAVGTVITVYIGTVKSSADTLKAGQLNQQLRAVMQIISNDIRRAGYWGAAAPGSVNPFTQADADINVLDNGTCILYTYDRDSDGTVDSNEHLGFRKSGDRVQMRKSGAGTTDCTDGSWEGVTNSATVVIDTLAFTTAGGKCQDVTADTAWTAGSTNAAVTAKPCAETSATGYSAPATGNSLVEIRQVNITLTGHIKDDATVTRVMTTSVRIRNDRIFTS